MGASNVLRRGWRWLAHTDVAAFLILALLLAVALGSLFPQAGAGLAGNPAERGRWQAAALTRYSGLFGPLAAIGFFDLPRSPVIVLPLALLALATLACTLRRWPRPWRVAGGARWPVLAAWGEHTAALLLLLGALVSTAFGWRQVATLTARSTTASQFGPLAARQVSFTIDRYPDGTPAGYRADVALTGDGSEEAGQVRVNRPLARQGIVLYLAGYRPAEEGYDVILLAVHDPGYPIVIAAGLLFLISATVRVALR